MDKGGGRVKEVPLEENYALLIVQPLPHAAGRFDFHFASVNFLSEKFKGNISLSS